jgi:hypothetical protein
VRSHDDGCINGAHHSRRGLAHWDRIDTVYMHPGKLRRDRHAGLRRAAGRRHADRPPDREGDARDENRELGLVIGNTVP